MPRCHQKSSGRIGSPIVFKAATTTSGSAAQIAWRRKGFFRRTVRGVNIALAARLFQLLRRKLGEARYPWFPSADRVIITQVAPATKGFRATVHLVDEAGLVRCRRKSTPFDEAVRLALAEKAPQAQGRLVQAWETVVRRLALERSSA
jgi:hypothetical protein